ncbi:MAG: peptidyl-prolyl cis-trans isomerase [Acidobacteriota bacterium]|jgi:peptidyl-prolyl cis-trans isomerase D|nr:peptidyl-prolyl cis-trans isomerase [Acidobacteriota bacterium]
MLKYLSKMERTRSLIIVGFAVLMAVSLVVFYAPARNATSGASQGTEVLATVGSDDITVGDVTNSLVTQGGDPSMMNRQIADMLLKSLIQRRVIVQEAKRLGLTASDAEVAARIREANKDASGKVDVQRYMDRVGDVARFEDGVRDQIAIEKLRAFVTSGVTVSEEELQSKFQRQNTLFSLVYVPIVADKLAAKINPTDQELSAYYEQHKTDYRILEEQKKIRYLFIDQNKVGEKIQIPETELRAEYDKLTPEQKQGGHRVQQIVLKIADPKLDETVRAKAAALATQARGQTGTMTEQEFSDLAKGHSEDPATAKAGGFVAGVVKKNPSKPDDPYQRTFETETGGISGPLKFGNAYYILRRGDSIPKTFEDAKPEMLISLRNRKAYAIAAGLAGRAADRLKETKDVQKVAQELAAEANMSASEMVKETPYVVPGDDVPNIGSSQQFEEGIKPLENPNDVGDRTPIKNGFAIPMLVDKKEPNRIPDFAEAKDKVLQAFRNERAKSQLEETARTLAGSVNTANDLKAAAEKLGLEAKTTDFYKPGAPLGDLDASGAAEEIIYAMKEGEVTKTPVKVGDDWVVVGATKRKEADLAEFAKQRDVLMKGALVERQSQVFEDYLLNAQSRMESEGKIKIYEDALAKIGDNEPTITNPQGPPRPTSGRPTK